MLRLSRLAGAALCCMPLCALAQSYRDGNGTVVRGFVPLVGCAAGAPCAGPASSSNPLPVIVIGGGGGGGSGSVSVTSLPSLPSGANVIGTVNTVATNPSSVYSNQQTCNVAAAALPTQALANGAVIKALKSNTATVYLGGANVTTSTGYPLVAGESISYAVSNLSGVYLICQNTTDVVAITGN